MEQVKKERTHWRDLALNDRHRKYGFNCPATDIDFFLEYDGGKSVAIIEYKHEYAPKIHPKTNYNIKALQNLASRAAVPFFAVRYANDFTWWTVVPLNKFAKQFLKTRTTMTELQYVTFLYDIRHRKIPQDVIRAIKEWQEQSKLTEI